MSAQQGKLLAQETTITFEGINTLPAVRLFHDGTNICKLSINPNRLSYYSMGGDEGGAYAIAASGVLDICRDGAFLGKDTQKWYMLSYSVSGTPYDELQETSAIAPLTLSGKWYAQLPDVITAGSETVTSGSGIYSGLTVDTYRRVTRSGAGRIEGDYEVEITGTKSALYIAARDQYRFPYAIGASKDAYDFIWTDGIVNNFPESQVLLSGLNLALLTEGSETWYLTVPQPTGTPLPNAQILSLSGSTRGLVASGWVTAVGLGIGSITCSSGPYNFALIVSGMGNVQVGDNLAFCLNKKYSPRSAASGTLDFVISGDTFSSSLGSDFTATIHGEKLLYADWEESRSHESATLSHPADYRVTYTESTVYNSTHTFGVLNHGYVSIDRINDQGQVLSNILGAFEDESLELPQITGNTHIAAYNDKIYLHQGRKIYKLSSSGTYSGLTHSGSLSGSPAPLSDWDDVNNFIYLPSASGDYLVSTRYDSINAQTILQCADPVTLSGTDRRAILDIPTYNVNIFPHALDPHTFFYIRSNSGWENTVKFQGSSSTVPTPSSSVFTDATQNFLGGSSPVKKGDVITLNKSGYASNGTYAISDVINTTTLQLNKTVSGSTDITYSIISNAQLVQFSLDPSKAAFSAVNVDDYSLRAGSTGDDSSTEVKVEVINAWGDPLNGARVDFALSVGDGVVDPLTVTTTGAGEATTTYRVGDVAGPVEIVATITDL